MFEDIKKHAYEANMLLYKFGIAPFTWGNASQCDREKKVFAIKPSGVKYEELSPDKMVVVDFAGNVIDGSFRPSSDTATHAVLYSVFDGIGGVVHTHSINAVAFAQAGIPIPSLGTTHADFSFGEIPCTRELTEDEVNNDYEKNTGHVIAEHFLSNSLSVESIPAVLVKSHGPFCWGKNAVQAANNGATLEIIAEMALKTISLNPDVESVSSYLLNKHYLRKHGKNAYYGQDRG